ncbi:MAG: hypothetical protein J4F49_07410 [Rhodobacteraceae bacterium]|nr:hypothetical protein [Paracoccaceae bacterium]
MARKREGALTESEKRIVKGLLSSGERNQDIQALVNLGREATINSARITKVKQDDTIVPAPEVELEFFWEKEEVLRSSNWFECIRRRTVDPCQRSNALGRSGFQQPGPQVQGIGICCSGKHRLDLFAA